MIRAYWYDIQGSSLGYTNLRARDTVAGSWTAYSASFSPPVGAAQVKIGLGSELQSGWIAFDDLSIVSRVAGIKGGEISAGGPDPGPGSTLYSTGFESGDSSWSSSKSGEFPATSIWNGTWGTGDQRSGSRAVVISNHVYGYLQSPEIAVQPSEEYRLSAWMRGEIVLRFALRKHPERSGGRDHLRRAARSAVQVAYANADESAGNWILRAYYYDANHSGLGRIRDQRGYEQQRLDHVERKERRLYHPLERGLRAGAVVQLYEQRLDRLGRRIAARAGHGHAQVLLRGRHSRGDAG
jgi:hypothetical protein